MRIHSAIIHNSTYEPNALRVRYRSALYLSYGTIYSIRRNLILASSNEGN